MLYILCTPFYSTLEIRFLRREGALEIDRSCFFSLTIILKIERVKVILWDSYLHTIYLTKVEHERKPRTTY